MVIIQQCVFLFPKAWKQEARAFRPMSPCTEKCLCKQACSALFSTGRRTAERLPELSRHPGAAYGSVRPPEETNSKLEATSRPPACNAIHTGLVKRIRRGADALALGAEERRDKLRKAPGRSKYPSIRGCLNGETRMSTPHASVRESIACGGEPAELKHLSRRRKRKKHRFRE